MATIAVGDIHGNRAALDDLLGELEAEVAPDDTVVFLGDYIDRGPDSKGCIDRIIQFRRTIRATVVTLVGNHEDWLLRTMRDHTCHDWLLAMDGVDTIESYSIQAAKVLKHEAWHAGAKLHGGGNGAALPYEVFFDTVPRDHMAFFEDLQVFHESEDAICVHGGFDPFGGPIEMQLRDTLIWGTARFLRAYEGPKVVMYGHRNNAVVDANGWPGPAVGRFTVGVDTISHGVLTAYRLPDGRVFQSKRFE